MTPLWATLFQLNAHLKELEMSMRKLDGCWCLKLTWAHVWLARGTIVWATLHGTWPNWGCGQAYRTCRNSSSAPDKKFIFESFLIIIP
jgi:hypothetical protein